MRNVIFILILSLNSIYSLAHESKFTHYHLIGYQEKAALP